MAKKENRVVGYPRMWIKLKLKKEAEKLGVSESEIVCDALFQYFNKGGTHSKDK